MAAEGGGGGGGARGGLCRWLAGYLHCAPPDPDRTAGRVLNRRAHMANERTFLAWIRTALGMMGFGFVVHRFNLFAKQLALLIPPSQRLPHPAPHLGLILIALGSFLGGLAAIRFLIVEYEIETASYRPSVILNVSLALIVIALGIFLTISLWE